MGAKALWRARIAGRSGDGNGGYAVESPRCGIVGGLCCVSETGGNGAVVSCRVKIGRAKRWIKYA